MNYRDNVGALLTFLILILLFTSCRWENKADPDQAPYPPSRFVKSITWDYFNKIRLAPGSDLWPVTWADDDNIYTSWGDGGGFGGSNKTGRVKLGFARIEGNPPNLRGSNIWGGENAENRFEFEGKCAGILAVKGVLYAWINMQNGSPPDVRLAWSLDKGASWELSDWAFPSSGSFFPSTFLNYGKDYLDARDDYIYSYGGQWIWAQGPENSVYLARVGIHEVKQKTSFEFFAGIDGSGKPTWSADISERKPVFTDPKGVGNTGLAQVTYNKSIGRYLLTVGHRSDDNKDAVANELRRLGVFDAPEPWGPWTTIAYYNDWGGYGDGEALGYSIPTKFISEDGRTFWMVFSSTGKFDSFNLIRGTLVSKNDPGYLR